MGMALRDIDGKESRYLLDKASRPLYPYCANTRKPIVCGNTGIIKNQVKRKH